MSTSVCLTPSSPAVATIRQFVCFPDCNELVPRGSARLIEFRVVIGYGSGLVGSFWSRARSLPQPEDFLEFAHVLHDMSRLGWTSGYATQVAVEKLGLNLEVIDHPLDPISAWNVEAHLTAALTNLTTTVPPSELAARRKEISDAARTRLQTALEAFMAGLDPEILAIVGNRTPVLPSHYNYFVAGDRLLRRNRLQGWRTFPLAFRYLTEPLAPSVTMLALSRAIDAGEPLVPLLAKRMKVSQATARAVLACPPDAAIQPWRCDLDRMGEAIDQVEPAFRPKTESDWAALHAIARGLRNLLGRYEDEELCRRWLNDIARDGWSVWTGEAHNMGFLVIEEMVRAAVEVGVARTRVSNLAVREAVFRILARKRFATAVRLGEAWAAAFQVEQDRVALEGTSDSVVRWHVPLPSFRTNERSIHALNTPGALYAEGRAMNHCVGSYIGQCIGGHNQIWSVRTLSGERCSTLATRFADGKDGAPFVSQHKGPSNTRPDEVSEAAAEALVAHMHALRDTLAEYHAWRAAAQRRDVSKFVNRPELRVSEAALREAVPALLAAALACRTAAA